MSTLHDVLENGDGCVKESHGQRRIIASEGISQATLKPLLKYLLEANGTSVAIDEDNCRVALVVLADLHRYFLIFEALRQAAHACMIPSGVRAALRVANMSFRDRC